MDALPSLLRGITAISTGTLHLAGDLSDNAEALRLELDKVPLRMSLVDERDPASDGDSASGSDEGQRGRAGKARRKAKSRRSAKAKGKGKGRALDTDDEDERFSAVKPEIVSVSSSPGDTTPLEGTLFCARCNRHLGRLAFAAHEDDCMMAWTVNAMAVSARICRLPSIAIN